MKLFSIFLVVPGEVYCHKEEDGLASIYSSYRNLFLFSRKLVYDSKFSRRFENSKFSKTEELFWLSSK